MVERTTVRCSVVKMAMVACQRGLKTPNLRHKMQYIAFKSIEFACLLALFLGNVVIICTCPFLFDLFGVISTYAFKICFVLGRANALVRICSTKTPNLSNILLFKRYSETNRYKPH